MTDVNLGPKCFHCGEWVGDNGYFASCSDISGSSFCNYEHYMAWHAPPGWSCRYKGYMDEIEIKRKEWLKGEIAKMVDAGKTRWLHRPTNCEIDYPTVADVEKGPWNINWGRDSWKKDSNDMTKDKLEAVLKWALHKIIHRDSGDFVISQLGEPWGSVPYMKIVEGLETIIGNIDQPK